MRISLHRPHQIGGCITVIESGRTKIIIDFGSNLPGTKKKEFGQRQINSITKNTDAIFFTHYHGDHTGLIHKIPDSIPLYMGMGAKEVMECKFDTLKRAAAYHDGKESKQYTEQANSLAAVQRMLTFKEDERIKRLCIRFMEEAYKEALKSDEPFEVIRSRYNSELKTVKDTSVQIKDKSEEKSQKGDLSQVQVGAEIEL